MARLDRFSNEKVRRRTGVRRERNKNRETAIVVAWPELDWTQRAFEGDHQGDGTGDVAEKWLSV